MAVVWEKQIGSARVRIADDMYRDCTPEELERRRNAFDRVVADILLRSAEREAALEAEQAKQATMAT